MSDDVLSLLRNKTVPQWLERQAAHMPNRLAASLPAWRGYRERLTYAQLVRHMQRTACGLHELGIRRGDCVALFLSNRAAREATLTALGCWQLGAMVVPVNRRYADEELCHALNLVEPRFIVVQDHVDAGRLRTLHPGRCVLLNAEGAPPGCELWPEPLERGHVTLPDTSAVTADDSSCLLFTSGTTARSKAVEHTHRSQLHAGAAMGAALELTSDDTYQGAFPLYTSSAFNLACMSAWVYGAAVVLEEDGLSNEMRLRLIESECTTVYHGVPAILHFLIEAYARGYYDMSRVRRVGYGGAAMSREIIELYRCHWPNADQVQVWGMTETGPAGTVLPARMLDTHAGAIGVAQLGCRVRLVADYTPGDVLREVALGEVGEIAFSGPSAARGYFRNPEATAQTFVDGWVLSGDLARQDADGVLHYVDRKKDIINRGGLKVASAAVEDVLYRYEAVQEAAVIGVPHSHLGEDIAACVVPRAGMEIDVAQLEEHCRQMLADYEVPRRWYVLEALPRNPMGKVQKNVLREHVLAR
ncbi:acyl--CoA ligase [bacterium SGD-2]|nr:acyl--CoA ligase [bacterium SGD-2]